MSAYGAFTFDCFGTLVDWRRGMRAALADLPAFAALNAAAAAPASAGPHERAAELIAAREAAEQELQRGPFLPYREILARSIRTAWLQVLRRELPGEQALAFADAQAHWPAFPDTAAALQRLAALAPLALLSNCDPEPLRACAARELRAPIALFVDAGRAGSYKPAPGHWRAALAALRLPPSRILHVSAYEFYDLHPAHALGFATAFVARDGEQPPKDFQPAFQARDLADLADQLGG